MNAPIVRVAIDHQNSDQLAKELTSSPDFDAACPRPGESSRWIFFGSQQASEELQYYASEQHGGEAIVYRFPMASLARKEFVLHVLALALGHKRELLSTIELAWPAGQTQTGGAPRSVAWIGSVSAGLSQGRLHDVFATLSRLRDLGLKDELGDLNVPVSAAAVLFARIVQTELEFLHAASRKHDLHLADQFVSEGYFRTLTAGNTVSVRADLATSGQFARRLELLDLLDPTHKAFLGEVARNRYGQNTNRVFLIQTAFYAKCAAEELAMQRPSDAFALVFKGFECLAIWENLANGTAYLYEHRAFKTDHTKFEGVGAAWGNAKGTLITRIDAASYSAVDDMIEDRNVSRVGHGLSVLSASVVTRHLDLLTKYIAATARVRGVIDYYQLLADAHVISGYCATLGSAIGQHLLKDHRVAAAA